jgi:LDH2 family malate/lactate/ureidoglycolate dehydrogenase
MSQAVSASNLEDFVARALTSLGVPEPDAGQVAEMMVEADLLGHDTHGVFRLRQ